MKFRTDALKEWNNLDRSTQQQFAKQLKKNTENPPIKELPDCYKIKLKSSGSQLVYQLINDELIIAVVTVGIRVLSDVYSLASKRLR